MDKAKYLPRIIDNLILDYLNAFGAVCIEGPKWCGKTWSAENCARSTFYVGDPSGNFQNRHLAEMDPLSILPGPVPRLIDEWQEVPAIWDAVRFEVDNRAERGQFVLTGSATRSHVGILHSGTGRIARLRMMPMSLYESKDSSGAVSLQSICNGKVDTMFTGDVSLRRLAYLILRGGWPGNLGLETRNATLLPTQYIRNVIEEDIDRLDGKFRDKVKMRLLLRSIARNESTTVSKKKLRDDISGISGKLIDENTLNDYLDVFRRLFIIEMQRPFSDSVRSSMYVKQAEKYHFADPSLSCSLLGIASEEALINDLQTFGFMFESLCERDLRIYANAFGGELYHYQDYRDNEIDAVVAMPNGEWSAFEIKLGANQIDDAAEKLLRLNSKFKNPAKSLCVICGLSNASYKREDGVIVVPITALRP